MHRSACRSRWRPDEKCIACTRLTTLSTTCACRSPAAATRDNECTQLSDTDDELETAEASRTSSRLSACSASCVGKGWERRTDSMVSFKSDVEAIQEAEPSRQSSLSTIVEQSLGGSSTAVDYRKAHREMNACSSCLCCSSEVADSSCSSEVSVVSTKQSTSDDCQLRQMTDQSRATSSSSVMPMCPFCALNTAEKLQRACRSEVDEEVDDAASTCYSEVTRQSSSEVILLSAKGSRADSDVLRQTTSACQCSGADSRKTAVWKCSHDEHNWSGLKQNVQWFNNCSVPGNRQHTCAKQVSSSDVSLLSAKGSSQGNSEWFQSNVMGSVKCMVWEAKRQASLLSAKGSSPDNTGWCQSNIADSGKYMASVPKRQASLQSAIGEQSFDKRAKLGRDNQTCKRDGNETIDNKPTSSGKALSSEKAPSPDNSDSGKYTAGEPERQANQLSAAGEQSYDKRSPKGHDNETCQGVNTSKSGFRQCDGNEALDDGSTSRGKTLSSEIGSSTDDNAQWLVTNDDQSNSTDADGVIVADPQNLNNMCNCRRLEQERRQSVRLVVTSTAGSSNNKNRISSTQFSHVSSAGSTSTKLDKDGGITSYESEADEQLYEEEQCQTVERLLRDGGVVYFHGGQWKPCCNRSVCDCEMCLSKDGSRQSIRQHQTRGNRSVISDTRSTQSAVYDIQSSRRAESAATRGNGVSTTAASATSKINESRTSLSVEDVDRIYRRTTGDSEMSALNEKQFMDGNCPGTPAAGYAPRDPDCCSQKSATTATHMSSSFQSDVASKRPSRASTLTASDVVRRTPCCYQRRADKDDAAASKSCDRQQQHDDNFDDDDRCNPLTTIVNRRCDCAVPVPRSICAPPTRVQRTDSSSGNESPESRSRISCGGRSVPSELKRDGDDDSEVQSVHETSSVLDGHCELQCLSCGHQCPRAAEVQWSALPWLVRFLAGRPTSPQKVDSDHQLDDTDSDAYKAAAESYVEKLVQSCQSAPTQLVTEPAEKSRRDASQQTSDTALTTHASVSETVWELAETEVSTVAEDTKFRSQGTSTDDLEVTESGAGQSQETQAISAPTQLATEPAEQSSRRDASQQTSDTALTIHAAVSETVWELPETEVSTVAEDTKFRSQGTSTDDLEVTESGAGQSQETPETSTPEVDSTKPVGVDIAPCSGNVSKAVESTRTTLHDEADAGAQTQQHRVVVTIDRSENDATLLAALNKSLSTDKFGDITEGTQLTVASKMPTHSGGVAQQQQQQQQQQPQSEKPSDACSCSPTPEQQMKESTANNVSGMQMSSTSPVVGSDPSPRTVDDGDHAADVQSTSKLPSATLSPGSTAAAKLQSSEFETIESPKAKKQAPGGWMSVTLEEFDTKLAVSVTSHPTKSHTSNVSAESYATAAVSDLSSPADTESSARRSKPASAESKTGSAEPDLTLASMKSLPSAPKAKDDAGKTHAASPPTADFNELITQAGCTQSLPAASTTVNGSRLVDSSTEQDQRLPAKPDVAAKCKDVMSPVPPQKSSSEKSHISLTLDDFDARPSKTSSNRTPDPTRSKTKLSDTSLRQPNASPAPSSHASSYVTVASNADKSHSKTQLPYSASQTVVLTELKTSESKPGRDATQSQPTNCHPPSKCREVEQPQTRHSDESQTTKQVAFTADDKDHPASRIQRKPPPLVRNSPAGFSPEHDSSTQTTGLETQPGVATHPQISTSASPPSTSAIRCPEASSPAAATTETSQHDVQNDRMERDAIGVEQKSTKIIDRVLTFLPTLPGPESFDGIIDDSLVQAQLSPCVQKSVTSKETFGDSPLPVEVPALVYGVQNSEQQKQVIYPDKPHETLYEPPESPFEDNTKDEDDVRTLEEKSAAMSVNVDEINDNKPLLEPRRSLREIVFVSLCEEKQVKDADARTDENDDAEKMLLPIYYDRQKSVMENLAPIPPSVSRSGVVMTLSNYDDDDLTQEIVPNVDRRGKRSSKPTGVEIVKTKLTKLREKAKSTPSADGKKKNKRQSTFVQELLAEGKGKRPSPKNVAVEPEESLEPTALGQLERPSRRRHSSTTLLVALNRDTECDVAGEENVHLATRPSSMSYRYIVSPDAQYAGSRSRSRTSVFEPVKCKTAGVDKPSKLPGIPTNVDAAEAEFLPVSIKADGAKFLLAPPVSLLTAKPSAAFSSKEKEPVLSQYPSKWSPLPTASAPKHHHMRPQEVYVTLADLDRDDEYVLKKESEPTLSTAYSSDDSQIPFSSEVPAAVETNDAKPKQPQLLYQQDDEMLIFTLNSFDTFEDQSPSQAAVGDRGEVMSMRTELPASQTETPSRHRDIIAKHWGSSAQHADTAEPQLTRQVIFAAADENNKVQDNAAIRQRRPTSFVWDSSEGISSKLGRQDIKKPTTTSPANQRQAEAGTNKTNSAHEPDSDAGINRVSDRRAHLLNGVDVRTSTPQPKKSQVGATRDAIDEKAFKMLTSWKPDARTVTSGSRRSTLLSQLNKPKNRS